MSAAQSRKLQKNGFIVAFCRMPYVFLRKIKQSTNNNIVLKEKETLLMHRLIHNRGLKCG
jgi:hypothetical protein